ncbi:unnamed protein product [Prorocentrum cordatum]|nr:unnamed protein product [Polarella glacialis]
MRREQGFSCCFSGANVGHRFGPSFAGGGSRPAGSSLGGLRVAGSSARSRSEGPPGEPWRQWEERTVQLLGADGEVYGIRPSGERVQAAPGPCESTAADGDGGGHDRSPSGPSVATTSLLEALASVVEGGADPHVERGEVDGDRAMCSTLREHELARAAADAADPPGERPEGGADAVCSTLRGHELVELVRAAVDGADPPGELGEGGGADAVGGTLRGLADAAPLPGGPEAVRAAAARCAEGQGADGTARGEALLGSPAVGPLRLQDLGPPGGRVGASTPGGLRVFGPTASCHRAGRRRRGGRRHRRPAWGRPATPSDGGAAAGFGGARGGGGVGGPLRPVGAGSPYRPAAGRLAPAAGGPAGGEAERCGPAAGPGGGDLP